MGASTNNLNLYKTNMQTDGNDEFDFTRDLDENWDKIDARFNSADIIIKSTGWVGSKAPYSQTITVLNMTESINPTASLIYSNDYETAKNERSEYSKIYDGKSGSGTITFYSTSPTGIDLNVRIKNL